jgi:hypothetical protein
MTSTTLNDAERQLVMESIRHALLVVAPERVQPEASARPGDLHALESKLDALVAIARRTRSDCVEPYLAEILDDVCAKCGNQQNSGYCPLRHSGECVLYACAGPIMWAISGALRRMGDPEYLAVHGAADGCQAEPPHVESPRQELHP